MMVNRNIRKKRAAVYISLAGITALVYLLHFYTDIGKTEQLDGTAICSEIHRSDSRFKELTGRALDPLWRAPGGRTTPLTLKAAQACGYRHVGWATAGFLGDELPSESYPNRLLVDRAVNNLKDGDIIMAHLGIWSRKDPFAPMFEPLIAGLKAKGFCFSTRRGQT